MSTSSLTGVGSFGFGPALAGSKRTREMIAAQLAQSAQVAEKAAVPEQQAQATPEVLAEPKQDTEPALAQNSCCSGCSGKSECKKPSWQNWKGLEAGEA